MRFLLLISFSLLFACGKHEQKSTGSLLGGDVREIGEARGEDALTQAINADDEVRLVSVFASEWKIDQKLKNGRLPLTEACSLLKLKAVQKILELGADRELKDDENKSGVDYANESARLKRLFYPEEVLRQEMEFVKSVRLNKFADVKKLLAIGVDPNFILDVERTPSEVEAHFVGETPLTLAVMANLPNIIRTLLAPGSATDVNLANTRGDRALKLARDRSLTQIEKMLLQRGALE